MEDMVLSEEIEERIRKKLYGETFYKKESLLYHYTSLENLPKIISNGEITFRATNVRYLNDPNELLLSYKWRNTSVKKHFDKEWKKTFVISFSNEIAKIPIWSMYADNGRGVALGFNPNLLPNTIPSPFSFSKSFYFDDEEGAYLCEYIEKNWKSLKKDTNTILQCVSSIKSNAYEYEKESRLIFQSLPTNIKYAYKSNFIFSYIDVKIPTNSLSKIVVGANNDCELVENSIREYLYENGLKVNVGHSNIKTRW